MSEAVPVSVEQLDEIGNALGGQKQGKEWLCRCPAHDDRKPSLNISIGRNGQFVFFCHAGCHWKDIERAIEEKTGVEIWVRQQAFAQKGKKPRPVEPVAVYEYANEKGKTKAVYRSLCMGVDCSYCAHANIPHEDRRPGSKHVSGKGTNKGLHVLFWVNGTYQKAVPANTQTVILTEGEHAAQHLSARHDVVCATWCGGTQAVRHFDPVRLVSIPRLVYWADRDKAGHQCAKDLKQKLNGRLDTILCEAGEDGADAADFDFEHLMMRLKLLNEGFLMPISQRVMVEPHIQAEHILHCINSIGDQLRFNARTHQMEVAPAEKLPTVAFEKIQEGWMENRARLLPTRIRYRKYDKKGEATWTPFAPSDTQMKGHIAAVSFKLMQENPVDEVLEWFEGLPPWDGQERIEDFLSDNYGAAKNDLNRWASAALFIQVIKRQIHPGCPWRGIPILIGPQFSGKSTMVKWLLPEHLREEYFLEELHLDVSTKERTELLRGKAICELAEMAGQAKSDMARVKAWISLTHDEARVAYGHNPIKYPRRCAFVGTMNTGEEITADLSGTTRWVCVLCPESVHVEAILTEDLRQQLYAEALLKMDDPRWHNGITRSLMEAQQEVNLEHTRSNESFDDLARICYEYSLETNIEYKAIEWAWHCKLVEHGVPKFQNGIEEAAFIASLKKAGMERGKLKRMNGNAPARYWFAPSASQSSVER